MTYWWGGTKLDRGDDLKDGEDRYNSCRYQRGTRAGWWNRYTIDTYNIWTPKYVVARDWTSHWKYKKWERQQQEQTWTGKTGAQWEALAWKSEEKK